MLKKKKILSMVLTIGMIVSVGGTALGAQENHNIVGGWSESTGYYINGFVEDSQELGVATYANPSKTPDSHMGRRLTKVINSGGDVAYAAEGETVWYHKYHYTTAQMELSNGTVKTTSGRIWDDNATKATSPYYIPGFFDNTEARTYWGS